MMFLKFPPQKAWLIFSILMNIKAEDLQDLVLFVFYRVFLSNVFQIMKLQILLNNHIDFRLSVFYNFIGNFPVPEFAQKFPIFKGTNNMPKTDPKEKIWWLWDGEKEWRVGKLSLQEQMKYPLDGICDITALVLKIERGKGPGGFDVLC